MFNYLKRVVLFSLLAILGLGLFKTFNLTWDYASRDPAKDLALESCPRVSSDELAEFQFKLGALLHEAGEVTRNTSLTDSEAAQMFNSLHIQAEELSYPECASILSEVVSLSFKYEAKARSARAQGGIFSHFWYQYYHMVSIDYMYLVPFITRQIMPPLPPNDGQYHA